MEDPFNWEHYLREALKSVPVPELSEGFDDRLLQSLKQRQTPWKRCWMTTLRPVLAAMCCSLLATAVAVHVTMNTPVLHTGQQLQSAAPLGTDMAALDLILDSPKLSAGSLGALSRSVALSSPIIEPPDAPGRQNRRTLDPNRSLFS